MCDKAGRKIVARLRGFSPNRGAALLTLPTIQTSDFSSISISILFPRSLVAAFGHSVEFL